VGGFEESIDSLARETGFSRVVHRYGTGYDAFAKAYGLVDRRHGVANTTDTQFSIASATKGLTALTVISNTLRGRLSDREAAGPRPRSLTVPAPSDHLARRRGAAARVQPAGRRQVRRPDGRARFSGVLPTSQGFHVSLDVTDPDPQGGAKSKTFWVSGDCGGSTLPG
jgi:hypothetical protein